MDKKIRYNYPCMRRDIQDEYLAAMLVGASGDTPDLMEIQMTANEALPEIADRLGLDLADYIIAEEEFEKESEKYRNSRYRK